MGLFVIKFIRVYLVQIFHTNRVLKIAEGNLRNAEKDSLYFNFNFYDYLSKKKTTINNYKMCVKYK